MAAVGPAGRTGPGKSVKRWQRGSSFLLKQSQLGENEIVLLLGDGAPLAFSVEYGTADAVGRWVIGLSPCLTKTLNAWLRRAAVNS